MQCLLLNNTHYVCVCKCALARGENLAPVMAFSSARSSAIPDLIPYYLHPRLT